ncbi:J domain-containing protein required for chloroplast accumulation response 1 [Galdieria sulphuraria]|uniref:DnaJ homolog subfamily C member 6 n=1 Tax=Galdieria sulphuraria TaxID=130081 RepID=M2VV66_GALSU|nr:DnaJ homolog subfamily C member 6 [Galdieria sulphuraria]EME27106.1 DnaJ homolog subfamily C member 6 [Galdieria sulphuraria]GJD05663.1 J domain-containing protein required for chloroplast accumulation response 1 [Galdieria sulphuraria]|eukprot:XP_005703626.1 DnaJ homolog subfamily C member 6 [Galdieria sulphuraria]
MGDFYDPSFAEENTSIHNKNTSGWSETLRHFGVEAKRAAERTKQSILHKMGRIETTKNAQLDNALEKYTQMGAALDRLRRDAQSALDSLQNCCSSQSNFAHSLEAAVRLCTYDEAKENDNLEAVSTLLLGGQVTLLDGVLYESQKKFRACIFKFLDEEKLREKDVQSRLEARKKIVADYERYRSRLESETSGSSQETLRKLNNKKQELDAITRGLEDTLETAIPRRRLLVEHVITEFLEISQKFYHEASRVFDQIADGANTEKLASLKVSSDIDETRGSNSSQKRVSEERSRSISQGSGSNIAEEPSEDKYSKGSSSRRRPPSPPLVFPGANAGVHESLVEEDSSSSSSEEDIRKEQKIKEPTRSTSGHIWGIHGEKEANLFGSDEEEERVGSRESAFSFKAAENDQSKSNQKFFETTSEESRSNRQRSSSFQADSPTTKEDSLFEEKERELDQDTSSDDDDALSHPASRSRSFDDLLGESRRNETLEEGDLLGDFDNTNTQGERNETKKPNPFDDDLLFSSGPEFSNAQSQSTSQPGSGMSFNAKENIDLGSGTESEETIRARLEPRVEAKINQWTLHGTRKTNLRLLLSMLHTVLWSGARWKPVDFQSLSNPDKVKAVYKKAILILHPDKFQQSGYSVEQKMIAERCFSILREAHDYFEAELKGKPLPNPANAAGASNASQMYANSQQGGYYPTGGMGRGSGVYPGPPPPPYANGAYYQPPQGNMPFGGMPSHGPPPPPPPGGAYGAPPPPPPPYGWDPRMGQRRYPPY